MKVAAIDIGTNSTRLLIAAVDESGAMEEIARLTTITRLGQGVSDFSLLRDDAINRTVDVLSKYSVVAHDYNVEKIIAVTTSAVRDANNEQAFLDKAREVLGVEPQVISGNQEAHLAYAGVLSDSKIIGANRNLLVTDIGGGSTEIVFGDLQAPIFSTSLPLGCVRLLEDFFQTDPPAPSDIGTLQLHVRRVLESELDTDLGDRFVPVAVAGTASALAAITLKLKIYDPEKVHLFNLSLDNVLDILDKLSVMHLSERREVVGLEPERADVIVAGTAILAEVMDFFGLDHFIISECDILDGLALSAFTST